MIIILPNYLKGTNFVILIYLIELTMLLYIFRYTIRLSLFTRLPIEIWLWRMFWPTPCLAPSSRCPCRRTRMCTSARHGRTYGSSHIDMGRSISRRIFRFFLCYII